MDSFTICKLPFIRRMVVSGFSETVSIKSQFNINGIPLSLVNEIIINPSNNTDLPSTGYQLFLMPRKAYSLIILLNCRGKKRKRFCFAPFAAAAIRLPQNFYKSFILMPKLVLFFAFCLKNNYFPKAKLSKINIIVSSLQARLAFRPKL